VGRPETGAGGPDRPRLPLPAADDPVRDDGRGGTRQSRQTMPPA